MGKGMGRATRPSKGVRIMSYVALCALLISLASWCAYKGYKAGYRNGLIHASLQQQLRWMQQEHH